MTGVILAILGLALGGLLKGATGAGAPILAVPILAMYFSVPVAISVFAVPNILGNLWQIWAFRKQRLPRRFMLMFAGGGALGTVVGTQLLVNLPGDAMLFAVALALFFYVGFRLSRPSWILPYPLAERISALAGTLGGVLFGATGLSAPVTLSFLNSMKLERGQFIGTVTVFFTMTGVVQIPMLFWYGIMDLERLALSAAAVIPVFLFMPVGHWLGRYLSRDVFDKITLTILTIIAIRLTWQAFF